MKKVLPIIVTVGLMSLLGSCGDTSSVVSSVVVNPSSEAPSSEPAPSSESVISSEPIVSSDSTLPSSSNVNEVTKVLDLTALSASFTDAAKNAKGDATNPGVSITDGFFVGWGIYADTSVIKFAGSSDVANKNHYMEFEVPAAGTITLKGKSGSGYSPRDMYLASVATDGTYKVIAVADGTYNPAPDGKAIWYTPTWNLPAAGKYYLLVSDNSQIQTMSVTYDTTVQTKEANPLTITPADPNVLEGMELYPMSIENGKTVGNYTFSSTTSKVTCGSTRTLATNDKSSVYVKLTSGDSISITTTESGTFTVYATADTATGVSATFSITNAADGSSLKIASIVSTADDGKDLSSKAVSYTASAGGTFKFSADQNACIYRIKFAA
jgi:hypothetical protein